MGVVGFRAWCLSTLGELWPIGVTTAPQWTPGEPAICVASGPQHLPAMVPAAGCGCGYWAKWDLAKIHDVACYPMVAAEGIVIGHGRVVGHADSDGFRCRYATVVALWPRLRRASVVPYLEMAAKLYHVDRVFEAAPTDKEALELASSYGLIGAAARARYGRTLPRTTVHLAATTTLYTPTCVCCHLALSPMALAGGNQSLSWTCPGCGAFNQTHLLVQVS